MNNIKIKLCIECYMENETRLRIGDTITIANNHDCDTGHNEFKEGNK